MNESPAVSGRLGQLLGRHWFFIFSLILGIHVVLPMAVDGVTHFFSDLPGLGVGFRYTNAWLAALTQQAFPVSFYVGEAWGSLNSLARLVSGVFFGAGVVWFGFPFLDMAFSQQARTTTRVAGYYLPPLANDSHLEKF